MSKCGCTPSRAAGATAVAATTWQVSGAGSDSQMLAVPAGFYLLGGDGPECNPGDREGPVRKVWVDEFLMDTCAVSNAQFARFVTASGYRTDAERLGESFVFAGLLGDAQAPLLPGLPWWSLVAGACWRAPEGPDSTWLGREDHPVVQVSWNDAMAYAHWAGKRLPSEVQWEAAARGGRVGSIFPWGDELEQDGVHHCNVWQGDFPQHNSGEDGFTGTAPVDSFEPNGYGLYHMIGNVWEWCADSWSEGSVAKVIRGGSYLCHASYCNRYRLSARSHNTPDSSTGHMGFRCVI